jgi:signal transduction histidine kinase
LLSAKALESRCASCHGPGEVAPRAERARQARELYDGISVVREQLKLAQSFIRRVDDKTRRAQLEIAYQQAEVPLIQAIEAGHRFVYDDLRERAAVARTRTEALLKQLANPAARR